MIKKYFYFYGLIIIIITLFVVTLIKGWKINTEIKIKNGAKLLVVTDILFKNEIVFI